MTARAPDTGAPPPPSTADLPAALELPQPTALVGVAGTPPAGAPWPTVAPPARLAPGIADRLRDRRPALFLDYDGTLTPIVSRPELARLAPETREAVRALATAGHPVAVVSGRDLDDVRALVNLPQLVYAGSHGFDIAGPGGLRLQHPEALRLLPHLDGAQDLLAARLAGVPGVQIERKRFSLAVHYRQVAPGNIPALEQAVAEAAHPGLRRAGGKMVFELQPALDWHKGRAVEWVLDSLDLNRPQILPLYLGDDLTDEDAFRALQGRGLGIVVRDQPPRPTAADYALADPAEVRLFLEALARVWPG